MLNIHYLQHVPFEGLGSINDWIRAKGHHLTCTKFFLDEILPDISEIEWIIIAGGPMNIYQYDQYPWLKSEKKFIREAVDMGLRVLGICLGAQLIADALNARVSPGRHKEIGWYKVRKANELSGTELDLILPYEFDAFHWHGDTFELPPDSVRLAGSDACENQGFIYRNSVIALQFHLESTANSVKNLADNCGSELVKAPYIQDIEQMLAFEERFTRANELMFKILDYMESEHTTEKL